MKINLLSCDAIRPDKKGIANCIEAIAIDINAAQAFQFTEILLEGDPIDFDVDDKNSGSALRALRKLDIDYQILD
ncbi:MULTISPECIES: hypothetical protein [unclassified Olleya]|mgnify:FL=1|jgi:hypothetical protein|uniref:hypothetical protein n=1 Tax=unclassified Olleya TaxID=2615019 RepID=UPI00119EA1B5|nr:MULTISPECIES: hypothetical protein [unclassified Olleya]TVZ49792.1 hypothetical protein JM82_0227 [Olleya sp. Hel_I_94]|tara:strand:- start:6063 stop:6287 length:225 start_codon:yes stop_codon:yes gene_type:complete